MVKDKNGKGNGKQKDQSVTTTRQGSRSFLTELQQSEGTAPSESGNVAVNKTTSLVEPSTQPNKEGAGGSFPQPVAPPPQAADNSKEPDGKRLSQQKSLNIVKEGTDSLSRARSLDKQSRSPPYALSKNKIMSFFKNTEKLPNNSNNHHNHNSNNSNNSYHKDDRSTNGLLPKEEQLNGHTHTTNHTNNDFGDSEQRRHHKVFESTDRVANDISATFIYRPSSEGGSTNGVLGGSKRIATEAKKIFKMAAPASVQQSVQFISKMFTISIVGHYAGTNEMAAASLGFTFINVTGMSIIMGLSSAMDTFANQSYTGNRKMTGVYLQKCLVVSLFVSIFIAVIWSFSGAFFLALQIDAEVCRLVQIYVSYSIIGLVPNVIFSGMQKFLFAQGIFTPVFLIQVALLPLYCGSQYYLVTGPLGFIGAPIALALCDWLFAFLLIIYARFIDGYQAWGGFTWRAFEGLSEYCKLAFLSVLQICSEWWAFEITAVEAGWINVDSLAAQSVLSSTSSFMFNLFIGVAISASVQVGNYLGAKEPKKAKLAANLCLVIALGVGLTSGLLFIILRYQWADLFTKDQHIIDLIATMLPLSCLGGVFDAVQTSGGGILRGVGYQNIGAIVNSISWYGFGIPLGYFLTFHYGFGLKGIWIGIALSMFLQSAIYVVYLYFFINWERAAFQAQRRISSSEDLSQGLLDDERISSEA